MHLNRCALYNASVVSLLLYVGMAAQVQAQDGSLDGVGDVTASTLFPQYYRVEPVTFSLRNDSDQTIMLNNSAPWHIEQLPGNRVVFSPAALDIIVPLAPGQSTEWVWDQRDDSGSQVSLGRYRVVFHQLGVSVDFMVIFMEGSRGYFRFSVADESLRVFMTNPQAIRDAIDNYYGKNRKNIPMGLVVDDRPGKSPYDPQWSWHLDPTTIEMVDMAIELCDGLPSFVEHNLDYWLESVRQYCPWSAHVESLN